MSSKAELHLRIEELLASEERLVIEIERLRRALRIACAAAEQMLDPSLDEEFATISKEFGPGSP